MTKRSAHFSLVLSLLFTVQLFAQLERKYPSGDIDMSQHSIQPIRLQKMQFNKPHESQEHPIQSYRTLSGGLLTMNSDLQVTSKRIPTTNNPSIWSTGRFISSSASRKYTGVERTEIFLSEAIKRYNLDISMDVLHLVDVRHHPRTRRSRYQYRIGGIPVWGSEITVHTQASQFHLTGTLHPLPPTDNLVPVLTKDDTWEIIEQDLARASIRITGASRKKQHEHLFGEDVIELVLFPNKESLELVWHVSIHPNLASRWEYFVDAIDGQIIQKYESLCKLHDPPLVDGKSEGNGIDLNGTARTLQTWQVGAVHILMDASQGMFRPDLSNMPEDPVGVILTLDAENTFPGSDDFTFRDLISNSTAWSNPVAVSAHTNAEEAFSYFENTFERISINGQGGNIFSLINVVDEEGQDMDNAFWNGVAIFYGKGKQAFTSPLARSLDVAAHELAHGVIQTTANLTYQGESGALNESFADVFATMIDRSNWQIGEDIVNTTIFRTGALRDLSNPHNGGSRVGDPGYQPQVYTERFTGREDNGGVHINSGIPNHAFFLFAQSVGKDVAEQIYYTVLDEYLTKSSQFVDLRIAVVTESRLRFGENSSVHNAAKAAFDAVGILGETGGNYTEDVEENPGEDFILVTDEDFSAIRLIDETGQSLASDPITTVGPLSRPSVTDDGEIMVYVAQDKTIQYIQFDWEAREFSRGVLEENPIWHNAAISKDGWKLAAITDEISDSVYVFSLADSTFLIYELSNPTTADGQDISTGDVLFTDAMEWDHTGEFLLYDAFNSIQKAGGAESIGYWDIGFIRIWDEAANDYGDGFITKLFSGLPESVSVGNPTFSKNSPYIIAFDLIDETTETTEYSILGVNIETGDLGILYENNTLGFPNYSRLDDKVVFDTDNGFIFTNKVVAQINTAADKISSTGDATILQDLSRWGVWFSNGSRDLSTPVVDRKVDQFLDVYPNPVFEDIRIRGDLIGILSYSLYSIDGLLVKTGELKIGQRGARIVVGELNSGMYILRLSTEDRYQISKIYKN